MTEIHCSSKRSSRSATLNLKIYHDIGYCYVCIKDEGICGAMIKYKCSLVLGDKLSSSDLLTSAGCATKVVSMAVSSGS
jgi:hypothetical protein